MPAFERNRRLLARRRCKAAGVLALLAVLLAGAPAAAGEREDREREALRRLQSQVRKTEQEAGRLRQEKAALDAQVKTLSEQYDKSSRAEKSLAAQKRKLTASLADTQQKLEATTQLQATTASTLLQREDELTTTKASLAEREREIAACTDKNVKLYKIGNEVIERYENQGVLDDLLVHEPFTQIKRVELENLAEEYRDKIRAERVLPATR